MRWYGYDTHDTACRQVSRQIVGTHDPHAGDSGNPDSNPDKVSGYGPAASMWRRIRRRRSRPRLARKLRLARRARPGHRPRTCLRADTHRQACPRPSGEGLGTPFEKPPPCTRPPWNLAISRDGFWRSADVNSCVLPTPKLPLRMARLSEPIPRLLAPRLREALTDTPAVLVHGPRQCGKTTLARLVGDPRG